MSKKSKKTVTNTSDLAPITILASALSDMGGADVIVKQEATGQQQLTESDTLPTDMDEYREVFEKMGIVFGEPVEGDPMFTYCTLPSGWKKKATNHPLWSDLLDDKGRVRAEIFYKAAFYDRSAFIRPVCRITVIPRYFDDEVFFQVCDGSTVIFRTESLQCAKVMDAPSKVRQVAVEWANKHFPEWENLNAYWEQDELKTE